ncbi:uncharacterized protein LOC116424642 isoform X2 [Nomia melanderi]|nr:uncharacterized protein LOC116424642 isoform X2 [Nomia melanderi]
MDLPTETYQGGFYLRARSRGVRDTFKTARTTLGFGILANSGLRKETPLEPTDLLRSPGTSQHGNRFSYSRLLITVMVPVSSTVIPLPVYKVVYGLGVLSKDKKAQSSFKPEGGVKLITNKKAQEKKT